MSNVYQMNKNRVRAGDRIEIIKPCVTYGDYNVGDFAIVKEVDTDGVIVTWEKGMQPPDRRLNFVMHMEYKICTPRLTNIERIAIAALIATVVVVFAANALGLYDYL